VDQKDFGVIIMAKSAITKPAAKTAASADNLLLIKGIGPVNNTKLLAHGIASFAQIAAWKKSDVVSVEKYLEFDGRIAREDWIGQAARLAKAAKAKAASKPAAPKAAAVKAATVKAQASAKPTAAPKPKAVAVAAVKSKPAAAAKPAVSAAKPVAKANAAPKPMMAASPKPAAKAKAAPASKSAATAKVGAHPAQAKAAVTIKALAPAMPDIEPIMTARGLVKRYGRVTALNEADFDLRPNEILAVIGDNGAGKSSLIKAVSGALPSTARRCISNRRWKRARRALRLFIRTSLCRRPCRFPTTCSLAAKSAAKALWANGSKCLTATRWRSAPATS
jgi:ABC transporter